jgi:hypothetical protein
MIVSIPLMSDLERLIDTVEVCYCILILRERSKIKAGRCFEGILL